MAPHLKNLITQPAFANYLGKLLLQTNQMEACTVIESDKDQTIMKGWTLSFLDSNFFKKVIQEVKEIEKIEEKPKKVNDEEEFTQPDEESEKPK